MTNKNVVYLKNENLKTIKEGFEGVPFKKGRFLGEFESRKGDIKTKYKSITAFIKNDLRKELRKEKSTALNIQEKKTLKKEGDFIVWLGHSSFLIQLENKKILTDPCFSTPPLMRRITKAPFKIKDMGHIDYMLISHGHHDHLDTKTIKSAGHFISNALVPLKMGKLIRRTNRHIKIQEAAWYQKYETEDVEVFLMPAHHWHKRTPFDINSVLWGSFVIKGGSKTIYFAGDSGYNTHFKEIAKIFGPIDIAIMPINPPYIIGGSHMTHQETILALKELDAKTVIPMHYGTFKLTTESSHELMSWYKKLNTDKKVEGNLLMPSIGEMLKL